MNFFTFIIQSEIPANCQNIKLQAANIKTANKERSDTSFSCIINYFSFATIWPDLTCSPSLTNILSTVPLIGARIFVSIFIASMTAIGCFSATASPSFTSILRMLPGMLAPISVGSSGFANSTFGPEKFKLSALLSLTFTLQRA